MFLFFNSLFEILLFQNCISRFIPSITFIDEILTITLLLLCLLELLKRKRKRALLRVEYVAIVNMALFISFGILGSVIHNIQPQLIAVYKDILAISKFFICFIAGLILSKNINKEKLLDSVAKRARVYINIIFLFAIVNLLIDTLLGSGFRYGIRCYRFLFSQPTYLVSAMIILLAIVIASGKRKFDKLIIFETIFVLISTLRNKAFMIVVGYFFIKFILKYFQRIKLIHLLIVTAVGIGITYTKIIGTLAYGLLAARPALYIVGIQLAMKYFPIGSGFGTFASSLSGEYYSPIYYEYSINDVWGLTPQMHNYMADTFWPYIYGQFGIIGFIIFIILLINIFMSIKRRYNYCTNKIIAALLIYTYVLIASTAEAIFTDAMGTIMFLVIVVYLGDNNIIFKKKKFKGSF